MRCHPNAESLHGRCAACGRTWEQDAKTIIVGRTQTYPRPARRGPAWYWVYQCTGPDGRRFDNRSIVDLRRALKRCYGRDVVVVEPWKDGAS